MKNILIVTLIFFFFACNKEAEEESVRCNEPIGSLRAKLNDTLTFDAKYTYFQDSDDDLIAIRSQTEGSFCLLTGSLSIHVEKKIGEQELTKYIADGTRGPGETTFYDYDDDVILGEFDLFEGEEAQIEITSINEKNIEGVFSATYIWNKSPYRFTALPDTLRFRNVSFKAELFK